MSVDEVKARTQAYRQVACLLAANSIQGTRAAASSRSSEDGDAGASDKISLPDWSNCPPDVEVTEYLLPKHPGFISASLLQSVSHTDEEKEEKQMEEDPSSAAPKKEVYLPICQECGGALQPGYGGTSIRIHSAPKLSRSKRRRASRRKAATLRKSKRDRKQQQPGNNSKPRSNLWQYIQDPKRAIFDCCKNYITLTCGYCGATSRLSGQSNPKPERKPQQVDNKRDGRPVKARTGGVDAKLFGDKRQRVSFNNADQSTKAATTSSDANAADNEEEFLSLAPAAAVAAPPKRTKEPPKLGQPKKKKKKKTGDLMNFLSSLND